MRYYTYIHCPVEIEGQYTCIGEIEEDLETCEKGISEANNMLRMLSTCSSPSELMSKDDIEDGELPLVWLDETITKLLDNLRECTLQKYKLELLKQWWDVSHDKDGLAIRPPEGIYDYDECESVKAWCYGNVDCVPTPEEIDEARTPEMSKDTIQLYVNSFSRIKTEKDLVAMLKYREGLYEKEKQYFAEAIAERDEKRKTNS